MRVTVGLFLGISLVAIVPATAAVGLPGRLAASAQGSAATPVEFFCSPGYEPGRGGTCVAVPSRAEIELFVDQPIYGEEVERRIVHHRHRRHGLRERY